MRNKLNGLAVCSIVLVLPAAAVAAEPVQTTIKLDLRRDLITRVHSLIPAS
jgi:hypothetical protein